MQATQIANANCGGNNGGNYGGNYANGGIRNEGNDGGNNDNNNNNPRRRRNKRTPDDATFERQDKSKYCHTHGAGNHALDDCNRRVLGHRNAATFANKMGYSKVFCNQGNAE